MQIQRVEKSSISDSSHGLLSTRPWLDMMIIMREVPWDRLSTRSQHDLPCGSYFSSYLLYYLSQENFTISLSTHRALLREMQVEFLEIV